MRQLYRIVLSAIFLVTATACERRSLNCNDNISIPVKIDWSTSGIIPGQGNDADFVHRVSIRFFPKDGSPAFDRYLEGNVSEGVINVPAGKYSVVAYNEAIDDPYWSNSIKFSNTDDYNEFSANIVEVSPTSYDFYIPQQGEIFAAEPLKLASWSLDNFEVSQSRKNCWECSNNTSYALTKIKLRRLVVLTHVVADVSTLKSAMRIEAVLNGMVSKVYMASGEPSTIPATHLFAFQSPVWDDETHTNGWVERKLLTFGHLLQPSSYMLHLGVILVTGERYTPDTHLRYDVTTQVEMSLRGEDIEIRVTLALPEVDSDINIGDWDDEDHIIQ